MACSQTSESPPVRTFSDKVGVFSAEKQKNAIWSETNDLTRAKMVQEKTWGEGELVREAEGVRE